MACRKITAGVGGDVCNLEPGGVRDEAYLGNRDDIDAIGRDANPLLVNSLTLRTGAKLFRITGVKGSIKPSWSTVKGKYQKYFTHRVEMTAFDNKPETLKAIADMNGSDMFVIIVNNNKTIEILGLDAGLEFEEGSRNYQSRDEGLASAVVLQTPDDENLPSEIYMPVLYKNVDFNTTLASIKAKI